MSIRALLSFSSPFLGNRLGVGAPVPETLAPAQTRLVQKLEGSKKRVREMQNGTQAPMGSNDEQREEADSAEESRAAGIAIRKRRRVDPFESGGKKKKKKVVELVGTAETAQAKDSDDVETEEAPQSRSMATDDGLTRSSPKKKKKKKHRLESVGAQGHVSPGGPVGEARSARLDADITQHAETSSEPFILEEWDGILQDQRGNRSGTPGSSCSGACFHLAPF
jgi:hypothetical protein